MDALSRFSEARSLVDLAEVNLGASGIRLYLPQEIEAGQVGYAVAPDGSSLSSMKEGAWQPGWIVIGYDTGSGDPLLMDTNDVALPVLRDFNGRGRWNPVRIAMSLEAFLSSFAEFARIANLRGTPVALEEQPITEDELRKFLSRISELNRGQTGLDFWTALLEG